jgi:GxxExxY protein
VGLGLSVVVSVVRIFCLRVLSYSRYLITQNLDVIIYGSTDLCLEPVYQEALQLEFSDRGIPFQPQTELPIFYKGQKLKTHYRSDFMCYESVIVELKALTQIGDGEVAQVLNYLKASRRERALLINFGSRSLQHERLVWSAAAQAAEPKPT